MSICKVNKTNLDSNDNVNTFSLLHRPLVPITLGGGGGGLLYESDGDDRRTF